MVPMWSKWAHIWYMKKPTLPNISVKFFIYIKEKVSCDILGLNLQQKKISHGPIFDTVLFVDFKVFQIFTKII